jgi:cyclophilin family peptidyl-prolyl cis-trans isomerase
VLAQLLNDNPENVRIVYRHFPLVSIHPNASLATQASEAAGMQGKFWEMHDLLFARQGEWSQLPEDQFRAWLSDSAVELGLDVAKFETDLDSPELVALAQDAWDYGVSIGLPGTPFLLINGQPYQGGMDYGTLSGIVQVFQMSDMQFTQCPPNVIDPSKKYQARIETEKGDIVIELFADKSPLAVNNFVFLAQQGWFDGMTFHRVLPDMVAQTGDPSGTGFGNPGYFFVNENSEGLKFDKAGVVGMANSGQDRNGSQFFITYDVLADLDGGYTIFGQVIEGMDVVNALTPRDPSQSSSLPPGDKVIRVVIEEQ